MTFISYELFVKTKRKARIEKRNVKSRRNSINSKNEALGFYHRDHKKTSLTPTQIHHIKEIKEAATKNSQMN